MTDTVKNLIIYSMNCKIAQSKLEGDSREQSSTIHNIVNVNSLITSGATRNNNNTYTFSPDFSKLLISQILKTFYVT